MQIEIIVSTYNSVWPLQLTLASVLAQDVIPDSICIADDGSGSETAMMVEALCVAHANRNIRHVWHEDQGFEKNVILNKAVSTSTADFLIFIDGDCLIHPCFVKRHIELAHKRRFSCGSLIRLSDEATRSVTMEDVIAGTIFTNKWLSEAGVFTKYTTYLKSMPWPPWVLSALELLWPIRRTWCGANASTFRSNILEMNGFDETMKYGGGDKEFGIRLKNAGVAGRHLRFTAPLVHLDHPRGYSDPEKRKHHREIMATTRATKKTWTDDGIQKP